MILAILIFCISVLILSTNIHLYIISEKDTIKSILKIGVFKFLVPHQRLLSKLQKSSTNIRNYKKWTSKKPKAFILNIFSHSTIDHIYIAKYSNLPINTIPITNGLYYTITGLIFGILHSRTRHVDRKDLRLQYVSSYENVDYYVDTHIDIITFVWVSIISLFGGRK